MSILTIALASALLFNADSLDIKAAQFLKKWNIRGMQVCVMQNDTVKLRRAYGWADKENGEKMTEDHIFRIASVSKLITAAGIMKLEEQGRLSLDDKVFGKDGILSEYGNSPIDRRYLDITVDNLLRHEGGFYEEVLDPVFDTAEIMKMYGLDEVPDHRTLISTLFHRHPLRFTPGTSNSYSNTGFLLLSMIIEKITGEDYEKWILANILGPAGCRNMHIGGNYLEDRLPCEVHYYSHNPTLYREFNNSGNMVDRCYGNNDISSAGGAGGWVSSTTDIARFIAAIDGKAEVRDILTTSSIHKMTMWFDTNTYSLGWNDTSPVTGWVRTGSFTGTNALVWNRPDGLCWIFITNTSTSRGSKLARDLKALADESSVTPILHP